MIEVTTEITASVAITAAPSSPEAINSESRITPAPEVPPTTTPYPTALAPRPALLILRSRRLARRRSGMLRINMLPITSAAPALLSRV